MRKNDYSSLEAFLDRKTDVTSAKKHIFYCIDFEQDKIAGAYDTAKYPSFEPYYAVSSISKMFETEESATYTGKHMHNSSKLLTLENIKEDMATSALFHKIDFSSKQTVPLSFGHFSYMLNDLDSESKQLAARLCVMYPFRSHANSIVFKGNGLYCAFSISLYNAVFSVNKPTTDSYSWYNRQTYTKYEFSNAEKKHTTIEKMYKDLQPCINVWKLENGRELQLLQCLSLNICT